MIQTNRYLISVTPAGRETEVMLSQYENGRYLDFQLLGLSGEIPDDVVATIQGTKPDGTIYSKVGTYADGVATFEEDTQLTAVEGEWEAKLRLTANAETIATERIRFVIDPATVAEGAVPLDTQLDGYIAETQANAASARNAANDAEESATSAEQAAERAEDAKEAVLGMTVTAETLPPGSPATAAYDDGVMTLGIPEGEKGDTGEKGDKGDKGDPGDPTELIDDTAGSGDTSRTWSADKLTDLKEDFSDITEESANLGYVTAFDGTKTISNVTIARKNANTLTVYGTANGWGKFDVLRGNNNVTAGTPTLSANLSAGTYTLVCNAVFDVLVGTDYSSSVSWNNGVTKTFATDVCVWLRVTSSSRNYGTADNPSEFTFAIYIGETDTTEIVPAGLIGVDSIARKSIANIDAELGSADIDSVVNEEFDDAKLYNIVPPDIAWLENSIINFNTGGVQSYNGTCVSDYIEIDPTFSYLCNYINVRVIGDSNIADGSVGIFIRTAIAFYDKDKGFVATTSNSTDASKAIPSTAKYVRLTLEKADYIPYAIAFYGNYSTAQRVRYTPYRKQPKQLQFYGYTGFENLEMVMFGDSITHGDLGISDDGISYVDYANDFLRGNIINVGLGGSRLSQGDPTGVGLGSFASLCENIVSDSETAWDALDTYASSSNQTWIPHINKVKAVDWSKIQAIGLLYGANDWNNNVPIGTETNNDPTKYDGACVYGLDLLLTKYPHLQVILFTPFYRKIDATRDADTPNTAGYTIFDYGKSLQENVRPVFHCPVVDSGNEVGINRYNIYVYTQLVDGTHPRTNIAQYRLGRYFAESIKRYIQPF